MNAESLLLTGATGLVGRMLIPLLKQHHPDRLITALVRKPEQSAELNRQGVCTVLGDLTRPQLGISPPEYRHLQENLTGILHVAADVRFDLPLEKSRVVNVGGVRKILELAQSCRRLRKFGHVSTAYVNGYREGVFAEEPMYPGQGFVNAYQQTKFEAEEMVLEAMHHIPASIYRIPLLLADSTDGVVSQFNYIHHLMRMLPDSILPVMPGNPDLLFDMVPADWAAAALAWVFDFRFAEGAIRHLCAGARSSMRLGEMMSRTCSTIESHPSYPVGRRVRFPQLVSVAEYERFVGNSSNGSQRLIAKVGHHIRFMGIRQIYLTERAQSDLDGSGLVLPEMPRCFENALRYCLDTGWGRKPLVSEAITTRTAG